MIVKLYTCLRNALLTLPVLLAVSCGGPKFKGTLTPRPGAAASQIVYLWSGNTTSIFTRDSHTGVLTPTMPGTIATELSRQKAILQQMVAQPTGRFVYVLNSAISDDDDATISMYRVNSSTGVLTPTTPATIATGSFPERIAIDPYGKFVYAANSHNDLVSTFAVDSATGMLHRAKVTSDAEREALVPSP